MKWVLASKADAALQEYDLMDNEERKIIVKYNPRQQSIRVTSGTHQRLFYLESAGSLSGKTIFKNEYGMETGNLSAGKLNTHDGAISIDEKKYYYRIQNNLAGELDIYDTNTNMPLMHCKLSNGLINTTILILSVCWYLSITVATEVAVVYAA